jgi:two-component system nitrogen regulation sensor histidine kinase NtrY
MGRLALIQDDEKGGAAAEAAVPRRFSNRLTFTLGLVVVTLALISGLATYFILTGLTPITPTHNVVVTVLMVNIALVLAMILVIAWQVTGLWIARRRQAAGARLHVRIVSLFSIIAVLPAILLAAFASVSLDRGLDAWFSSRTQSIIKNSIDVANAYLQEHGQVIRLDTLGMAKDIDEAVSLVSSNPQAFGKFLTAQAAIRAIPVAFLIDNQGKVLATAANPENWEYRAPPEGALELAKKGQAVMIAPGQTNMVGALKSLDNFSDTYLYVIRPVNAQVLQHLRETRANVAEYQQLDARRTGVQVAFALMYLAIALTLLLAAIWLGMWFANRLVSPIRQLIGAAQKVSSGDLDTAVAVRDRDGDLGSLGATFNTMTSELKSQRDELVNANSALLERRRFIEAVLSGVTAGVIGVDAQGVVTLANVSSETLLGLDESELVGRPLAEAAPEFGALMKRADSHDKGLFTEQISLIRDGAERIFAVRFTSERAGEENYGYVVTFDDITELVTAQRATAWADVARRIAHEIKNPLTPIQLSAERIRRKYGKVITQDREIFDQCTDTIIRQVGDIGRMVDEFSSFARMPKPQMEANDLRDVVREAVFLFQVSRPEIEFELDLPQTPVVTLCDRRLISQAVTNLVKNASEAIDAAERTEDYKGHVVAKLRNRGDRVTISVIDNGCGLPAENRSRLTEPYMTTREKGTGLGLAIVQKITEQHGGVLSLQDAPRREGVTQGACVKLDLPLIAKVELPRAASESPDAPDRLQAEAPTPEKELTHGV